MEIASLCEISNLPYSTLKSAINPWAGVSVQVAESDNFSRSPSRCVPVIYLVLAIDRGSFSAPPRSRWSSRDTALPCPYL